MASLQHLKGLGCAEGTGLDPDVSGPAVGHHSAEAEGRLQDSQRTRGQFLQKPERPGLGCQSSNCPSVTLPRFCV